MTGEPTLNDAPPFEGETHFLLHAERLGMVCVYDDGERGPFGDVDVCTGSLTPADLRVIADAFTKAADFLDATP